LKRHGETSTAIKQTVMVLALAEELNPPEVLLKPFPRFYAKILTPENSPDWQAMGRDIRGMSGGPIIGVLRDDFGLRYWVIGIQSGWVDTRRVIAASYLQQFLQFVGEAIDDKFGL
jgi:hypothetical protein